ncbi:MAG: hypothetical protein ABJL99_27130 [Aliishimia sp.]
MDIGLYTGVITQSARSTGDEEVIAQEPEGLQPLPGILDAPNVIILGASIMDASFGSAQTLKPELQAYAQAAGFTGTLWARSQAGEKIAATSMRFDGVKVEPSIAATQGQNLYVVHTGGNDISGNRPWPGGQTQFSDGYQALMQVITATDQVLPLPLTKRLYPDAPVVLHGDVVSEENGSKPYNENLIYPAIDQFAPDWRDGTDVPYVNPYEMADRFPQLLNSDGIHGYSSSLGRYILARIAGRALGLSKGASRAGSAVLYSPGKDSPDMTSIGLINAFKFWGAGTFLGKPLLCGALTTTGAFDPFITLLTNDVFKGGSQNAGTGTYARIPDPRFHDPEIVNDGIYVQGTQIHEMYFEDLTPGDTVTVSVVGVRNAGGTNRRGVFALSTGQALELDASNVAGSNQIVFDPVVVPNDGKLTLSVSVAPGSTYAYLHGVLLEFS